MYWLSFDVRPCHLANGRILLESQPCNLLEVGFYWVANRLICLLRLSPSPMDLYFFTDHSTLRGTVGRSLGGGRALWAIGTLSPIFTGWHV